VCGVLCAFVTWSKSHCFVINVALMDTVDLVGVDILCPALRYIIFHFLKSLFKSSAVGLMHQLEVNSNYMISCVVTA